ncbi:hypothetical protein H0R92_12540 [Treponema sp. OMZ 840]|uniref:hypothetical protein n=1 Tax=Treponema sp. OMZ 840 TaxID=244313 RepID=UPI003D8F2D61
MRYCCFFSACTRPALQQEAGIIFSTDDCCPAQLWIDGKEGDITALQRYPDRWKSVYCYFDWKTNKVWAKTVSSGRDVFFFADVTGGTYDAAKEVVIKKRQGERPAAFYIYNDEIVLDYYKEEDTIYYPGLYAITDLKTGTERIIDIRDMFASMKITRNFLIGYDGKRLFFDKGRYDMENGQYYPYPSDKHSFISNHAKVSGMPWIIEVHGSDHFIRIYDIQSGTYRGDDINLQKIKKPWSMRWYAEKDRIFITMCTDADWIRPGRICKGRTFKYDIHNKTLTEIAMPHVYARVVGRIRE